MNQIITSMLDVDFYKYTMWLYAFRQRHAFQTVKYKFKCRTNGINLAKFAPEIGEQIKALDTLRFSESDINFIEENGIHDIQFLDFLKDFKFNTTYQVGRLVNNGEYSLTIVGAWHEVILYETMILAIINEVYFKQFDITTCTNDGNFNLKNKVQVIKANKELLQGRISEFGTRRRFSKQWQDHVLGHLLETVPDVISGTSNVALAQKYKITPVGTMAHEYLQAFQHVSPLHTCQVDAFNKWAAMHQGKHAIALSDIFGMDAFFVDFNKDLSIVYDGARHDSGNPFIWCEQLIDHYNSYGIDPKRKIALFSDGLDIPIAVELAKTFEGRINTMFGIGTNLSNDMLRHNKDDFFDRSKPSPISIVIKMIEVNGEPVAKLSDSKGKMMCEDSEYLAHLQQVIYRKTQGRVAKSVKALAS